MGLACFHKISGKWMCRIQVVSKAPDFKSFRNHATLLLCASAKDNFYGPCLGIEPQIHENSRKKTEVYASLLEVEQKSMNGI